MTPPQLPTASAILLAAYLVVYGALEAAWLLLMGGRYRANFQSVQGGVPPRYRTAYALVAYAVLLPTVFYFLVLPTLSAPSAARLPSPAQLATRATLLALLVYGTYNLTNLATLGGFGGGLALVDMLWGVALFNAVALAMLSLRRAQLAHAARHG